MSIEVVIIDYGIGNLFSVRRAFEHCGAKVEVTDDKSNRHGLANGATQA